MATVISDIIEGVSYEELGGTPQSCTRVFKVRDLAKGVGIGADACNTQGIPPANSVHPTYFNLICTRKSFEYEKDSNDHGIVYCVYEPISRAVFSAEEGQFRVTGGTGLVQKTTAYDRTGVQISVSHTFPSDDPDYPSETITQGAEVDVLAPQTTLIFEGLIRTSFPHYISSSWNGYLNSTYWAGGFAGTWMCTDVRFSLFDTPRPNFADSLDLWFPKWNFTFEFLWNYDGHVPYAMYIDERKNRPAPNLVANTGIKQVLWYPYRNFHELYSV